MNIRIILITALAIFCVEHGHSQNNTGPQDIGYMLATLQNRVNAAILKERSLSSSIRKSLNLIVEDKDLTRSFIFGKDDQFFKEGMSLEFNSEPKSLFIRLDRDEKIERLENEHIRLYNSDDRLLRWKLLENFITDTSKSSETMNAFKSNVESTFDTTTLLTTEYMITNILNGTYDKKKRTIESESRPSSSKFSIPKYNTEIHDLRHIPDSNIIATYPYNGQANFYKNENKRNIGYIKLAKSQPAVFYQTPEDSQIVIKWTNSDGKFTIGETYYDALETILCFRIPNKFLQSNQLYKYEILFHKPMSRYEINRRETFLNFTNRTYNVNYTEEELLPIEPLFTAYFRVSEHNTIDEKLKNIKSSKYKRKTNTHTRVLTEPFSESELNSSPSILSFGDQYAGSYSFEKLIGKKAIYYLSTPYIEKIDTLDYKRILSGELDHSLESELVVDLRAKFPSSLKPTYNLPDGSISGGAFRSFIIPESKFNLTMEHKLKNVTPENFRNNDYEVSKKSKFVMEFKVPDILSDALLESQEQIKVRMMDRAMFFYLFDIIKRKRANDPKRLSLKYFEDRELALLDDDLKILLQIKPDYKRGYEPKIATKYNLSGSTLVTTSKSYSAHKTAKIEQKKMGIGIYDLSTGKKIH